MDESRPIYTPSEKAKKQTLTISIKPRPFTPEEPYNDETVAMDSLPHENISPKDRTSACNTAPGLDNNVGMAGDSTSIKAQMPVISFSESCNLPPTKFTVPFSPPPRAYEWYDSDQSEETPPNLSDAFDSTMNAAHDSPSSCYFPCDESNEEASDYWDDSFPGPYGAEDYLECLYDAYLDEDMTSEVVQSDRKM